MRDGFFLCLLPLWLYTMACRPFIAVGMWLWTALFFPNAWMYSAVGTGIRYNLLFSGIAISGYLLSRYKPAVKFGRTGMLVLLFLAWSLVSTALTEGNPAVAWYYWERFLKVFLLFVFVILVLDKKLHIDFLLGCVVLSVGFYGVLEALKWLDSGGGHKIAGFQ